MSLRKLTKSKKNQSKELNKQELYYLKKVTILAYAEKVSISFIYYLGGNLELEF